MKSFRPSIFLRSHLQLISASFCRESRPCFLKTPTRSYSSQEPLNPDLNTPLLQHLRERHLIASVTDESVEKLLQNEKVTLYCGADPSAQSLHVGNLIPLIILIHFRTRGHSPITLVGGATGIVGDPSGRATERAQMEAKTRAGNVAKIRLQLETFLDRGKDAASRHGYPAENFGNRISTNNADWWKDMGMLQFLGTYGRHIRVGQMLARDSVKNRMESEQGIGFNEFAYQILQAYDFWHLHSTFGCRIQVGGNDQWGNITAGIDLISRLRSEVSKNEKEAKKGGENGLSKGTLPKVAKDLDPAYGITVPLLTTPSGEKFGKSAGNAVWIDPEMTKPYELYQYFVKSPDSVVEKYLKMFTFMSLDTISTIMKQHVENESIRHAQRILAKEVTDLVHGLGSGQNSAVMSEILFGGADEASSYDAATILSAFSSQDLVKKVPRSDLVGNPWRVILAGVTGKSKSEISRLLKGKGIYKSLERTPITQDIVEESDLIEGKLLLIRVGKASYYIIEAI